MFDPSYVDLPTLRKRAHNLRWATVPPGVIPLTAADPDFPCPAPVTEAIAAFLTKRYFSYGPPEGLPEFRESMARFFQEKRGIPTTATSVLPVDSAAFGIYITCKAFLNPATRPSSSIRWIFCSAMQSKKRKAKRHAYPSPRATRGLCETRTS